MDAAQAEHQERAELLVALEAHDDLLGVSGGPLLHQAPGDVGVGPQSLGAAGDVPEGLADGRLAFEIEHHPAHVGLVRDLRGGDLERHRAAHFLCGAHGLVAAAGQHGAWRGQIVGFEHLTLWPRASASSMTFAAAAMSRGGDSYTGTGFCFHRA